MAWTYEQLFNDLTNGDLEGQDSWSTVSGDEWQVVDTGTPYEGDKYVQISSDSQTERSITSVTSGIFYYSVKIVYPNGGYSTLQILDTNSVGIQLFHITGGNFQVQNALGGVSVIVNASSDTWVRIGIEFDSSTDQIRYNYNDGTWSSWIDLTGSFLGLETIRMTTQSAVDEDCSFDAISPNYTPVSNINIISPLLTTTSSLYAPTVSYLSNSITLTDVDNLKVIQRDTSNDGNLTISGTYTGNPTNIEARIVEDGTSTEVKTWTTIDSSPTGGTFSGELTGITQGGWYNIQVRFSNETSTTNEGTNKFGVGILIGLYGQSNMYYWSDPARGTDLTPNDLLSAYTTSWGQPTANGVVSLGNNIISAIGIPVGITNGGISGSAIADLQKGTANYTALTSLLTAIGGEVEYFVYNQGETDADNNMAEATYRGYLDTLLSDIQSDFSRSSGNLDIALQITGRRVDTGSDAGYNNIRNAQKSKILSDSSVYFGGQMIGLPLDGTVHYTDAGYTTAGKWASQTILYLEGEVSYYENAKITSLTEVSSTIVDINLEQAGGTDFTPTSAITGFRVLDDGTPVGLSSIVRSDATTIRITTSSALSGAVTADYLWGESPTVTNQVVDNTALTLPLEFNTEISSSIEIICPLLDTTSTLNAPTVTYPIKLNIPLLSTLSTFYTPTVSVEGGVTVNVPFLEIISSMKIPTIYYFSPTIWTNLPKNSSTYYNLTKN